MKKIFILLFFTALCTQPAWADKPVRIGIKVGANYTNPSGVNFSDWSARGSVRKGVGFTGGAFVKVKLPVTGLFVEAEALYSTYKVRIDNDGDTPDFKVKSEKTEFPVHVGLTFLKFIEVYTGPSFNYLSSSHTNLDDLELSDGRHGVKVAGDVGLRAVIQRFTVDFRYQFPFSGQKSFVQNMGNTLSFKSNPAMMTLSLGYSIL